MSTRDYLAVSGAFVSVAEASPVLPSFRPFSTSVFAEPRFRASFGMAAPPKMSTATTITTTNRSGPKISPKNTVYSFDVLTHKSSARPRGSYQRRHEPPSGSARISAVTSERRQTVRDALSVALTVGAYGVAFGAAGIAAGFTVLQTCLFSLLTFTGASQFAAVGVMAAGGGAISAVAAAAMLGTRNALYGLQMAPLVKVKGVHRF